MTEALGERSFRQTTIAKIENRDRGVTLDDALLLANALGVPLAWLLTPESASANVLIARQMQKARTVRQRMIAGGYGQRGMKAHSDEDVAFLVKMMPEEEQILYRNPALWILRDRVQRLLDDVLDGKDDRVKGHLDGIVREVDRLREEIEED